MCFDEWGPLELKPFGGVSWAKQRLARRMRATYRRLKGTEQFFGFFDVHADCLSGKFYKRKRLVELFDAFRRLRKCYTNKRLFVILDNLHGTHDNPRFLALLKKLRIHPVWTPTEASWLNVIETEFSALSRMCPCIAFSNCPLLMPSFRFNCVSSAYILKKYRWVPEGGHGP